MVYYARHGNPTALERKRQFEEELIYYDADTNSMTTSPASEHRGTSTTPFSPGVRPRMNQNQYKRQQTTFSSTFPSISSLSSSSSPSPSLRATSRSRPATATPTMSTVKVKIKTEEEANARAALQDRPLAERVRIYVGSKNKVFTVGIRDLDKSPVLKALLVHHDVPGAGAAGSEGPYNYIMHPELTKIDAEHFQPVFQFLLMDEYVPAIISNPKGPAVFPKQLDGLVTVSDYQREALRGAHIYVIAKALGMRGLEDLVFKKITQAQHFGGGGYGVKCQLDLAMVVFSRPEESELAKRAKHQLRGDDGADGGDGVALRDGEEEDRLEHWLIESLKDKLQQTLINHAKQFFNVANHGACARRGFAARIFRRKVEDWERLGGDVVAIEDDD